MLVVRVVVAGVVGDPDIAEVRCGADSKRERGRQRKMRERERKRNREREEKMQQQIAGAMEEQRTKTRMNEGMNKRFE